MTSISQERAAQLHDHGPVDRRGAAEGHSSQRKARDSDQAGHDDPAPQVAEAGLVPGTHRLDGESGGVHLFGSLANGRSTVNTSNKGLHFSEPFVRMASNVRTGVR